MDIVTTVNALALSVISGAYVLLFAIQIILWNRIEKIIGLISKLDNDLTDRMDVIDRVASEITDDEFNSKSVASGLQKFPGNKRIRKVFDRIPK